MRAYRPHYGRAFDGVGHDGRDADGVEYVAADVAAVSNYHLMTPTTVVKSTHWRRKSPAFFASRASSSASPIERWRRWSECRLSRLFPGLRSGLDGPGQSETPGYRMCQIPMSSRST